ncbi:MAG: 5-(carboxyamino)imidazole ribonucleotide synthase [Crocinitomicaceae bacterium]|nr:5-(carboxyamino)imidazole ribonucleotide synthase [Crocinitomicaceae bacterium]
MKQNLIGSGHRLGILGGGQLGRMFIQEAISYNIHVHIMDKDETSPCYSVATSFTAGDITNYDDVLAFGSTLDVLTVEIENVNIEALYALEEKGVKVFPQPRVLEIIKDKGLQKSFYKEHGIPTSAFTLIDANQNASNYTDQLPFVQKLRTGGYDGRGVEIMKKAEDLKSFFPEASIIEELVPFEKELSIIVARNEHGETTGYPTVECEFNAVNLVEYLFSPADISPEIEIKARKIAENVINALDMIGILAVELFLTKEGEILVNEAAPRPHNSGHHTIECNITSQFEQHMRSILNLPLGSTKMTRYGAMLNILGSENHSGIAIYDGLNKIVSKEGVHVHLYGKESTKPNRKMGHITVTGSTIDEAKNLANSIKGELSVIA